MGSLVLFSHNIVVVQSLRHVWHFATPWTVACQVPVSSTTSWSLLKFISIESGMLSNIWSSATPFSFCLQSFPRSRSFPMSQLFTSGGQSIGPSASASILPINIQSWFPLGLTGLVSLLSKGLFKNLLQHHSLKASVFQCSAFFMVLLSHLYLTTGKIIASTIRTFGSKVMYLFFNMLSRLS